MPNESRFVSHNIKINAVLLNGINASTKDFNAWSEFIKINNGSDGVVSGWLSTDTVAEVIAIVSSAKTQKEIEKKCLTLSLY